MQRNASSPREPDARVAPTLLVLFGGVLLGALDIAIVGPALPAIQSEMSLSSTASSAIFTVYILFGLIGAPLLASLSDSHGRRQVYVACLLLFGLGSAIVALAPGLEVLLAGRAIQAFGAGGTLPVASAVIADSFPESRRGRALGLIGAVFGLAFVIGPVVGGVLLQWSWRWLFVVNLPLVAILTGLAFRHLDNRRGSVRGRLDIGGMALLALGLTALTVGAAQLSLGESGLPQVGAGAVVAFVLAAAALVWFVRVEQRVAVPIVEPAMLRSGQMRLVGVLAIATGLVEASMVFLPSLAVQSLDVSPSRASFMLIPLVLAMIAGSVLAGRVLDVTGPKPVVQFGIACTITGLLLFALLPTATTSFYLAGLAVGFGLSSLLGAPLRYITLQIGGEAHRGASQGLLTIFLSGGRLFGASLTGGVAASAGAAAVGYRRAMLMIALGCCVALIATVGLQNHRRSSSASTA